MTRRHCRTFDLKNDPALLAEYARYHQKIWPEITRSIRIMEVNDTFSFEAKGHTDEANPEVREREEQMCDSSSLFLRPSLAKKGC